MCSRVIDCHLQTRAGRSLGKAVVFRPSIGIDAMQRHLLCAIFGFGDLLNYHFRSDVHFDSDWVADKNYCEGPPAGFGCLGAGMILTAGPRLPSGFLMCKSTEPSAWVTDSYFMSLGAVGGGGGIMDGAIGPEGAITPGATGAGGGEAPPTGATMPVEDGGGAPGTEEGMAWAIMSEREGPPWGLPPPAER